jgi:hypothetical protein
MDAFKEMAEDQMRTAISTQIEGEIDTAETDIKTREAEFRDLQSTDTRAEKRQMWMQSISGQSAPAAGGDMNPSSLGARPDALGSSGGRQMRGALGNQQQAPQARMGLSGMRSPMTSSKPLAPSNIPLTKPVKAPLGADSAPSLPQPIQKLVRAPLQPIASPEPETQMEQVAEPIIEPIAESVPEMEVEPVVDEPQEEDMSTTLRPITAVLQVLETPVAVKTTTLTPQLAQLIPQKERGSPPQSKRGSKPQAVETTTLKPVRKLTPLKLKPSVQVSSENEETGMEEE